MKIFVPAFQAGIVIGSLSQGVALGYVVPALQAENQTISCHLLQV
jgi:hypothetical protein